MQTSEQTAEVSAGPAISAVERARHISFAELLHFTGDRKTRAHGLIADPSSTYPKPVKHGRSTRFVLGEVLDYLDGLAAGRASAQAGDQ